MNPKNKHADWLLRPTANDLADALDWVCENHLIRIGNADFKATATMLRQQQAEIEALKAHPVKELTDDEILECWNETHPAVVCLNAELPLFARAILRKAQEK